LVESDLVESFFVESAFIESRIAFMRLGLGGAVGRLAWPAACSPAIPSAKTEIAMHAICRVTRSHPVFAARV
jgi:hypothetical protein